MKPVQQTHFGANEGNCTQACLASLLEIDISDIPWFVHPGRSWIDEMNRFLTRFDLAVMWMPAAAVLKFGLIPPDTYYLIGGISYRNIPHMVVGYNGNMVFDPHPSNTGLEIVEEYYFLLQRFTAPSDDRQFLNAVFGYDPNQLIPG